MKIAYHFLTKHPDIRGLYNVHVLGEFLQIVLQHPTLGLHTKVFTGDLALKNLGMIEAPGVHGTVGSFNREKFSDALNQWAFPASGVWSRMTMEALEACSTNDVYAVCIESVEEEDADDLHRRLISLSYYLGAMEVDDSSAVHWRIYSYGLDAAYRLMGRAANVFWQAFDPETKPAYQYRFDILQRSGFHPVEWESLDGRFTLFDAFQDPGHARRLAVWKRKAGSLLAFVADDAVSRLTDAAPELGDRLYTAIQDFTTAETTEELAHVTATCRRVFEYVTDCIFPPVPGRRDAAGHDLGTDKYRNRLLAFADAQHRSDTNIELVATSVKAWDEQVTKLERLANKGIHAKVFRAEARRCLIRTILLLDDIVALHPAPFPFRGHFES